ncbi:MAG: 4-hydroxy-3-methylbut-2-enyl diphosphate reductase [Treponema sp.]|nr:4-hydroxy-3-methylbut-2-enyl diphosphate reductase [Treponema sp.]
MVVQRAKVLGFCMGVRRAVELANKEAELAEINGTSVYTLGPLIHNPKVLKDLERRGVKTLDNPPSNKDSTVIVRAHGISPETESELRDKEFKIVDATCPKVKASQLKTQELSRAGYSIFLAGEERHAEIEGILGYAKDAPYCKVIGDSIEAQNAAAGLCKTNSKTRTALLGQTTISKEEYENIGNTIKKYFPGLITVNTICDATIERQQALRDLLMKSDAVIIAGGYDSANTRRLLAIAADSGKPCALVEDAEKIPESFYNYSKVGLCAGASTPDSLIDEIEKKLLNLSCKSHFA